MPRFKPLFLFQCSLTPISFDLLKSSKGISDKSPPCLSTLGIFIFTPGGGVPLETTHIKNLLNASKHDLYTAVPKTSHQALQHALNPTI